VRARRASRCVVAAVSGAAALSAFFGVGCTAEMIYALLGVNQEQPKLGIAFVRPLTNITVSPGAPATIQWSDLASVPGTEIKLIVERVDPATRDVISEIVLFESRDALADGGADLFDWDVTGVIVGRYSAVLTIRSPDGQNKTARSPGDILVTSAFPTPTLTFTAPGAADVTVEIGDTFTITWNDNGAANDQTQITLGLNLEGSASREDGDEIILARDIPASDNGNTGSFVFAVTDADGNQVPVGTYVLFAILEDGIHDDGLGGKIIVEATGRIIVAAP
jgi:hypothetical protein